MRERKGEREKGGDAEEDREKMCVWKIVREEERDRKRELCNSAHHDNVFSLMLFRQINRERERETDVERERERERERDAHV